MQFLSCNLQDYASSDKGHSNAFLTESILHVKSLEKPFNKPNDTPNRRDDALKDIESIWFPWSLMIFWKTS